MLLLLKSWRSSTDFTENHEGGCHRAENGLPGTARPQTRICRHEAGAEGWCPGPWPAAGQAEAAEFSEPPFPRVRSGRATSPRLQRRGPGRSRTLSHGGSRGLGDVHRVESPEVAGAAVQRKKRNVHLERLKDVRPCETSAAERPVPRRREGAESGTFLGWASQFPLSH